MHLWSSPSPSFLFLCCVLIFSSIRCGRGVLNAMQLSYKSARIIGCNYSWELWILWFKQVLIHHRYFESFLDIFCCMYLARKTFWSFIYINAMFHFMKCEYLGARNAVNRLANEVMNWIESNLTSLMLTTFFARHEERYGSIHIEKKRRSIDGLVIPSGSIVQFIR